MPNLAQHIKNNVKSSLDEDINNGDLTAQLLPDTLSASAQVITRQTGVLCGIEWFNGCFLALDPDCTINWLATDGDAIRQAMENLGSYDGLIKTYKQPFTADRHDALGADDYVIVHYDGNDIHPVN